MPGLDLADIRSYVYDAISIDSSDLPTAVLDSFIAQSWFRIINSERQWSFYEKRANFSTVANQQTYSLISLTNDEHEWRDIWTVEAPNWLLRPIDHREAQRSYAPGTTATGKPYYFSIRDAALYLWPIPNSVETMIVTGYRKPTDWIGDAEEPDAPDEFHSLVAQGALALAYAQQDDPAAAQLQQSMMQDALRNLRQQYVDDTTAGPNILNGNRPTRWFPHLYDRADRFG